MLGLILTLLFVALAAGILVAAGTVILQGYWYDSPVDGITWRSAIAGAVVGLFFAVWCGIESKAPGKFDSFFNFSSRDTVIYDQFWSVRKSDRGTKEILYTKSRGDRGTVIYVDADQRPWQRSLDGMMIAIIVEENGQRKRFDAELDEKGNFKFAEGRPLRFVEEGGSRYMTETALGQITTMRYGLLFGNLLWNLVHVVVWFACLWLLMQFQWPHALLLAVLAWLLFVLIVWPVVQERVRIAAVGG
jgi:hypothetical protein